MKRILILILIVFAAGCNSAKNAGGGSGASMQGIWTVTGNLGLHQQDWRYFFRSNGQERPSNMDTRPKPQQKASKLDWRARLPVQTNAVT